MAGEGRAEPPAEAQPGQAPHTWDSDGVESGSVTLGLVPAPEMPEEIAHELAEELSGLLGEHIDESVSWDVQVVTDPLTGGEYDAPQILEETHERLQEQGWDYAICLTDLPVLRGGHVVVADASVDRRVGGISLPALGVTLLRRRVREAMLQLVSEMHQGASEADRDREGRHEEAEEAGAGEPGLRGGDSRQLIGRRLTERLSPIQRTTPTDEDMDVDVRFVAPRRIGRLRLLSGMVFANRPWKLFTSFRGALAAAFATGAYALIFPTIWQLADAFGWARFVLLMVLSIVAMVVWIIVAHDLWERPAARQNRRLAELYNAVTGLTLSVAVLFAYAVLYVLALVAALFFVPADYFEQTVQHAVGPGDYLTLAWITTSLAMVAGTLGSGLESEETVLQATYGYRQRRRSEESDGTLEG